MNLIATGHFVIKKLIMAEPAMNDWLVKGTVPFMEM